VVAERSPAEAVAALERLAAGTVAVALVVAARQMEGLDGLAMLLRAHELHPAAKRVLLEHRGEWTSGEPVVRAMTLGQVDYVLFRPWLPREQFLYLPVSEFLAAWEKSRAPSTEAIQIVGRRWAASSHELRDTLARVGIPYGFYPDDSPAATCRWCCSTAAWSWSTRPTPSSPPPWACGPARRAAAATS
jgi:thioredoxin reductase (NADPH)